MTLEPRPGLSFRHVLRDGTIAMLKAANTIAGDRVGKEPTVPIQADNLPILAVYVPAEHKTSISEGGAPLYKAALTLHVEARVANADPSKVVSDLDVLLDQAQIALLCNPHFMRSSPTWPIEYVTEIIVRSQIDGDGEVFIGKGFVSLIVTYRDEYPPALPDELKRIVMMVRPWAEPLQPPAEPASIVPEISLDVQ
jgi:hypothetical protein